MGRNKKILIRSDTASKAKVNEEFRYEILDTKLSGYFIRVLTTGFKSYNIRGRLKGKQITVSIGDCQIISEQEARKKAQEFKQLMKEGVDPRTTYLHEEHDELTLLDLLEDYRDTRGPKLKTSTYRRYKYQLEFYCPKLSAKPAQDLTAKEIKDWYRSMRDRPTSGERTFVTMKTLLTFAYKTKLLPELVTEELSYIGRYSKSNEPKRFIAKQHIDAWCEAFFSLSPVIEPMQEDLSSYQQYNNNRISMTARDYILFLMVTGLRKSEATNLKWKDVDFQARTFDIPYNKAGRFMTVPMNRVTYCMLAYRNKLRDEKVGDRRKHQVYVFPSKTRTGGFADPRKALSKISQLGNFEEDISPHDLRRSFATYCKELGFTLDDTGKLLNHANRNVTDSYVNRSLEWQRDCYDKVVNFYEWNIKSGEKSYGIFNAWIVYFYGAEQDWFSVNPTPNQEADYWRHLPNWE